MSKQILTSLTKVFSENASLFICIFLLSTSPEIVFTIGRSDFKALVLNVLHGFTFSFICTFIYLCINKQFVRNLVLGLLLILLSISFFCDMICIIEYHSDFNGDFISAILGTDSSEIVEFLSLHAKGIAISSALLVLILGFFFLTRKVSIPLGNFVGIGALLVILAGGLVFSLKPNAATRILTERSFEGKFVSFIRYVQDIPPKISMDIPYEGHLSYKTEELPKNIVIIFGESHCRRQCQFYGYNKETMPRTQELIDKDSIFVFDRVTSPATSTIESFRSMMSTYKPEFETENPDFWEYPSLFQFMKEAGYNETWISNQSKHGMFDNLIGNYAELCDTTIFLGDKFSGLRRSSKDAELIPILEDIHQSATGLNLYFIHLMGNHDQFAARYPEEFNFYSSSDYPGKTDLQKGVLAAYDNSVRYTDWVINEVFEEFKEDEAIVLYFPDHGLDLFYTREDYFHHALASDPESSKVASEIPFLIYPTASFCKRYPETVTRIANSIHREWRTDDLLYTIMDIAGIRFSDSDEVQKNSLLIPVSDYYE